LRISFFGIRSILRRSPRNLGLAKDAPLRRAVQRLAHHHINLVRIASSLCTDMIFGKDKGL
jgi:hypothetical protein